MPNTADPDFYEIYWEKKRGHADLVRKNSMSACLLTVGYLSQDGADWIQVTHHAPHACNIIHDRLHGNRSTITLQNPIALDECSCAFGAARRAHATDFIQLAPADDAATAAHETFVATAAAAYLAVRNA